MKWEINGQKIGAVEYKLTGKTGSGHPNETAYVNFILSSEKFDIQKLKNAIKDWFNYNILEIETRYYDERVQKIIWQHKWHNINIETIMGRKMPNPFNF